jgi:hypothetical protein
MHIYFTLFSSFIIVRAPRYQRRDQKLLEKGDKTLVLLSKYSTALKRDDNQAAGRGAA